jgi:hypothetical protein
MNKNQATDEQWKTGNKYEQTLVNWACKQKVELRPSDICKG